MNQAACSQSLLSWIGIGVVAVSLSKGARGIGTRLRNEGVEDEGPIRGLDELVGAGGRAAAVAAAGELGRILVVSARQLLIHLRKALNGDCGPGRAGEGIPWVVRGARGPGDDGAAAYAATERRVPDRRGEGDKEENDGGGTHFGYGM